MRIPDIRNAGCTACKMHQHALEVCVMGSGPVPAKIMVVSKVANSTEYQLTLEEDLVAAGLEPRDIFFSQAIKCSRNFVHDPSNGDVKTCRTYLDQEIAIVKPEWVLTFGNEGLLATTGHSGIMKYRGRVVKRDGYSVFPTISPASVMRNPGQRQAYMADLHLFVATVFNQRATTPKPKVAVIKTRGQVKALKQLLDRAQLISYDIETTGDNEFKGQIVCLCGTLEVPVQNQQTGEIYIETPTFALPLFHPESPWRSCWRSLLRNLAPHLEPIPKQIAHNGKFDARWCRQAGLNMRVTFDTMLAAHLLDENRQKGLKPQAASRLGVAPWAIETRNLLKTPLKQILKYCVLDTWYTYHIYQPLRAELIALPRLTRIFQKLLMPAEENLIAAERRGIWVDPERLATRSKIAEDMVREVERELMLYVPEVDAAWPTYKSGKPVAVNFNASIFCKWLLFEHLGLPVLERGKIKPDGSQGDPSMKEAVMLELKSQHPVVSVLLKRGGWIKNLQFLDAYKELRDKNDRVHTTFKLYGTVTGRLSSGKAEADKVTGVRNIRGFNLQQVPRDEFARGVFGAAPGYIFVEVDFSQVELRVVAFLSRDRTMLMLYATGQDIHRATAAWVLGIPESKIDKNERKKAKAVNFGFVYGMGAKKFVATAFEKYELVFTLDEAQGIRRQFFENFSGLLPWHARQRRLVHQFGRVQSPIGRIRHLPDIRSSDPGVVAEAERQAINSPVQSFASDMNTLGMNLTVAQFKKLNLDAHVVGLVHDATLWEVRTDQVAEVIPIIKHQYENLPLRKMFGVNLDVPIVADCKVGRYWSEGATELTSDQVYNWNPHILEKG